MSASASPSPGPSGEPVLVDHFDAFVHSPQAYSSPRSPLSARDFSPELASRDFSPEVDSDDDDEMAAADRTLRPSEQGSTDDWLKYLDHSALFGSQHLACSKEQQAAEELDLLTAHFFDDNTTTVAAVKLEEDQQQQQQQQQASSSSPILFNPAAAVSSPLPPAVHVISPQAPPQAIDAAAVAPVKVEVPFANMFAHPQQDRFGPVQRSDSMSSVFSSDSDASMAQLPAAASNVYGSPSLASSASSSAASLLLLPSPPQQQQASYAPARGPSPPSLTSFTLNDASSVASAVSSGSGGKQPLSLINAHMLESACRTVYQLILDGHAPEAIDEFNQKLYSVTGHLVPTHVVLAAQRARNERLWTGSGSSASGSSGSGTDAASSFGSSGSSSSSDSDSDYAYHPRRTQQQQPRSVSATTFVNAVGVNQKIPTTTTNVHHATVPHQQHNPFNMSHKSPARRVVSDPLPTKTARRHAPYSSSSSSKKRFACGQCGLSFDRAFNLKTHVATHDTSRDKPYVCPYDGPDGACTRSFARKHDCQRHVRTVHIKRGTADASLLDLVVHAHGGDDDEEEAAQQSHALVV